MDTNNSSYLHVWHISHGQTANTKVEHSKIHRSNPQYRGAKYNTKLYRDGERQSGEQCQKNDILHWWMWISEGEVSKQLPLICKVFANLEHSISKMQCGNAFAFGGFGVYAHKMCRPSCNCILQLYQTLIPYWVQSWSNFHEWNLYKTVWLKTFRNLKGFFRIDWKWLGSCCQFTTKLDIVNVLLRQN